MNTTTNFFTDICDVYKDNKKINKEKIIRDMPDNLKLPPKVKLLELLPEELTVDDFINLLMVQTYGGDYVNFDAIQILCKLATDTNNNIVFNKDITYRNCKKEPYVIWLIVNMVKNHPFLSKYPKLLQISLEKKLELSIIASKSNFRYDCCFDAIGIAIECDENHHFGTKQIALDAEKSALVSLHGKNLVRFVTNKFDCIRQVRCNVKNNTIALVENNLIDFVEILCKLKFIKKYTSIKNIKTILKNRIVYQIYVYFAHAQTPAREESNTIFTLAFDNKTCDNINTRITTMLQNYIEPLIDDDIHMHIKDSKYLQNFNTELTNSILNAALLDYDFRLDYIKVIFQESLFDNFTRAINYLIVPQVDMHELIDDANKLQLLMCDFIKNSQDFDKIFELKKKSLQNLNNPYVITSDDIIQLYNINNSTDITYLINFIKRTCKIEDNQKILISWKMLNQVLLKYNDKPEIKSIMLMYYSELDTIYENIFNRTNTHTTATSGSEVKYNMYMQRLNKYLNINEALQNLALNEDSDSEDGEEPVQPTTIKLYNTYDLEYLQRINIAERIDVLIARFKTIKLTQTQILTISDSDEEPESDSDVE